MKRAAIAFVLSVVAAAIVSTLVPITFGLARYDTPLDWGAQDLRFIGFMLSFAAFLSAGAMVVVGLPLTLLLARLQREQRWSYPLFGCIEGILASSIFFMPVPFDPANVSFEILFAGGLAGLAAGVVWWHMYRRHHPTHDVPDTRRT